MLQEIFLIKMFLIEATEKTRLNGRIKNKFNFLCFFSHKKYRRNFNFPPT